MASFAAVPPLHTPLLLRAPRLLPSSVCSYLSSSGLFLRSSTLTCAAAAVGAKVWVQPGAARRYHPAVVRPDSPRWQAGVQPVVSWGDKQQRARS